MSVNLTYEEVEKVFPGKRIIHALKKVSFKIEQGELFCLLGPSGCGKTTLLRSTAGLERITGGRILYDDVDVTSIPPRKRQLGMVFQSFALYPHMSVYENVAFGLRVRKTAESEVRSRVKSIMDLVGLPDVLERNPSPSALSGGQQQRVAVARSLVYDPKILLLDEPFANLDAKLRRYMRAEIRRIQKITGVTTIFVTHDQEEAMAIGDRLAIMRDGQVEQIGTADEVYRFPVSRFVANFIGKMNFFPCVLTGKDDGIFTFRLAAGGVVWTGRPTSAGNTSPSLIAGSSAVLGFRPEFLRISSKPSAASCPGKVRIIQHLGQIVRYDIILTDGQIIEADARGHVPGIREGDSVFIGFETEGAMLFTEKEENKP